MADAKDIVGEYKKTDITYDGQVSYEREDGKYVLRFSYKWNKRWIINQPDLNLGDATAIFDRLTDSRCLYDFINNDLEFWDGKQWTKDNVKLRCLSPSEYKDTAIPV